MNAPAGRDPLVSIIEEHLGERFKVNDLIGQGKMGRVYEVTRHIPGIGSDKFAVKIRKPPEGVRATLWDERGYGIENEARILMDLDHPNIVHWHDYVDLRPAYDGSLILMDYFPGQNLEQLCRERKLNYREWVHVQDQLLEVIRFLYKENGLLHRDLKPDQVLVNEDLDLKLTDFALAKPAADTPTEWYPTTGSHQTADPMALGPLRGEPQRTTIQSELYAWAMTGLKVWNGRSPTHYYAQEGYGVRTDTRDFTWKEGTFYPERHDEAVTESVKTLRRHSRRVADILQRCTSVTGERYGTIDHLLEDWKRATSPGLVQQLQGAWKPVAMVGSSIAVLASLAYGVSMKVIQDNHQEEIAQVSLPQVAPEWDGSSMEIFNNLIDLDVKVQFNHDGKFRYTPRDPMVRTNPGDTINVYVKAKQLPLKSGKRIASLRGGVFIPGYEARDFNVWTTPVNEAGSVGNHYAMPPVGDFKIPEDVPCGVVPLVVALYSPTREELSEVDTNGTYTDLQVPDQSVWMNMRTIPLHLCDTDLAVGIYELSLPRYDSPALQITHSLRHQGVFSDSNDDGVIYEAELLGGEGWSAKSEAARGDTRLPLWLPDGRDTSLKTLQFTGRRDGTLVWYSFVPVERFCYFGCIDREEIIRNARDAVVRGTRGIPAISTERMEAALAQAQEKEKYTWRLAIPPRGYHAQLIEYGRALGLNQPAE